jgi:cytosine/adenosine deaminase-related metal-dependent hydrolase
LACCPGVRFARRTCVASQSRVNTVGRAASRHVGYVTIPRHAEFTRTIESGKVADLVLLDANPLEDIHNTQKISAVFIQGHYFDRPALDGRLQKAETQPAAAR